MAEDHPIMDELSEQAKEEHIKDPLGSSIEYLEDNCQEVDEDMKEGVEHSIYLLKKSYISYSGNYECVCPIPTPVKLKDGSWMCELCSESLVSEDESVV